MSALTDDFAQLARSFRRSTYRQPGRFHRARLLGTGRYVMTSNRGKR